MKFGILETFCFHLSQHNRIRILILKAAKMIEYPSPRESSKNVPEVGDEFSANFVKVASFT